MQLTLEKGSVLANPQTTMPNSQPRVSLPAYVLPLLVTLLLAFLANLSYSLYWAGQVAANQANMVEKLNELKIEMRDLRSENKELRDQLYEVGEAVVAAPVSGKTWARTRTPPRGCGWT